MAKPRKKDAASTETVTNGPALMLRNYDVVIVFADNTEEIVKVQAKHPLAALATARYTPEREWSAERLMQVVSAKVL